MNSLEKIFNSIRTSTSKEMKLFSTDELIAQLPEYEDYSLFILKNIYQLITSDVHHNRVCGAKLLKSLQFFSYEFDFSLSPNPVFTDFVYLQFKDFANEKVTGDLKSQRSKIKKALSKDLEHVETDFLEEKDMEKVVFKIELKTSDVKEKEIENISDFFEALNLILLSPDWNKRHGAFIAYAAIVASENEALDFDEEMKIARATTEALARSRFRKNQNQTKVQLKGDLFNKIFEILKNDKFSDFQEDVTSSPVREAACVLLKFIYPMINNRLVLHEITHLLSSRDWQEQFSALLALSQLKAHFTQDLVDGVGLIDNFFQLLVDQLESSDEDVKFLSADLVSFVLANFRVAGDLVVEIRDRCWAQIEEDEESSHSKASFLGLLRTIHGTALGVEVAPPASFAPLYPCFTSPIQIVKDGVFELSRVFDAEEFLYLLSEGILFETKGEYRHVPILRAKIARLPQETLVQFGEHFLRIIGHNIHQAYSEDDFACYDDTFFTSDGYKSVGMVTILNNRACLFGELLRIGGLENFGPSSLLSETFKFCYAREHCASTASEELEKRGDDAVSDEGDGSLGTLLTDKIEGAFKTYPSLKKMPFKEFQRLIVEPGYHSLYPLAFENCLELVRKSACEFLFDLRDFSLYFQMERSTVFLGLFCSLLAKSPKIKEVAACLTQLLIRSDNEMSKIQLEKSFNPAPKKVEKKKGMLAECTDDGKSYLEIVTEQTISNLCTFFNILGEKFVTYPIFDTLMESKDRLIFFKYTIKNYLDSERIFPIFHEALTKKNVPILRAFISSIQFNCAFVKRMLKEFDLFLAANLIEYSDPSFNVLFVKLILKNIGQQTDAAEPKIDTRTLLATVIGSLHFTPNRAIVDQELLDLIEKEKAEVKMIVDPTLIPEYKLAFPLSIELRDYQKEGVKWIAFLSRFNLNGILADDMGLGKTLQMLCFVINEMFLEGTRGCEGTPSVATAVGKCPLPTLILCPSSLTTHWKGEIEKYFDTPATVYDPKRPTDAKLVICSYDTLRRDTGALENRRWLTVVCDEGHVLKNRATVLYGKVKRLSSQRRFILTGTPIHNSVEDLFSLFDILMPNYLGTEASFVALYGCKVTDKNVETMKKRLDSLHKKTLPFIMRRLKTEVLKDLPPKIITDISVEMNPQQLALYKKTASGEEYEGSSGYGLLKAASLSRTRDCLRVTAHPRYFDPAIPSAKTAALQDIFSMSGIAKILIFFQFRATIDYVLEDLKPERFLRLDGSVPPNQRGEIVDRFNTEDIPYLFLTTSVGGLGLNLASANVVVFYEHDWNPFNDLQAMDRAHRLGQKNPVNVFRLICKGTVEETVMNYQNFKMYVANTIISQQNNEIVQIDTKDILERFQE